MTYSQFTHQNHVLNALDGDARSRLLPHLEEVELSLGEVLYETGDRLQYVYFPVDTLVSMLYVLEDGSSAEIALIGNDGMVGTGVFMSADVSRHRVLVQAAGRAQRMSAEQLRREFARYGALHSVLLAYTQALMTQMAQTAVCNRHHTVEQQLCRWLLLSLDRLPSNSLHMTQEQIARMLGVRREGVSEAAGKLQRLGIIQYSRGHIELLDRVQLEGISCECYGVVKRTVNGLIEAETA